MRNLRALSVTNPTAHALYAQTLISQTCCRLFRNMATVLPPPSKRQKVVAENEKRDFEDANKIPEGLGNVRVQFVDQATGSSTGVPVSLPVSQANTRNLELLLNSLQGQGEGFDTDKVPYRFSFQPHHEQTTDQDSSFDIFADLYNSIIKPNLKSTEDIITLQYTPQAVFRVRAVTRCTASISGHGQAILATQFSPASSSRMVSGSGDTTARIWDCETGTSFQTLKGHTSWVLVVSYSPDGSTIATGSYDNTARLWDAESGQPRGGPLRGHAKWITSIAWEPYHLQPPGRPRFATASKDASVRVWDAVSGRTDVHFTRHQSAVSCVKWGGTGNIFSSSHDKTVKIWDSHSGTLLHTLTSHVHWVNHLALSTDFVNRTAYYEHGTYVPDSDEARRQRALERFDVASKVAGKTVERLVTASDDCTMFLWDTTKLAKPVARLLGHQKQVNHVAFSPDGHYIASCGFDNHVKLWMARDGKFLRTLKGHVAAVYQCCFSADSRLLVSASKDTTLKAWDVRTGALVEDLPGHSDEVFAVDWSPDGKRVGSGGKDKSIKLWSN